MAKTMDESVFMDAGVALYTSRGSKHENVLIYTHDKVWRKAWRQSVACSVFRKRLTDISRLSWFALSSLTKQWGIRSALPRHGRRTTERPIRCEAHLNDEVPLPSHFQSH
jgi:hypothetical protein